MKYVPKHLKLWTMPDSYAGKTYFDYYPIVGRSRDSDVLENCNFEVALDDLGGESEHVIVARAGHWAVGWVETILVHKNAPKKILIAADAILDNLKDYPVLDDCAFSEAEEQERGDTWDNNGYGMIRDVLLDLKASDDVKESLDDDNFKELVRRVYWEDCFYCGNENAWVSGVDKVAFHMRSYDVGRDMDAVWMSSFCDLIGITLE